MEWKTVKLGEIGDIVGGATPSTKNPHYYDGDISWITPKDLATFSSRYITRGERNITAEGFKSSSCRMMPKGSVLFSSRAPIGYIAIAANELCTNQGFKSIVPNPEIADSEFIYYLLKYHKDYIAGLGSGTTFMEVSASVMRNIELSLPPLAEQKRIAAILSSLDAKIENNNRINANLEAQAQALYKSWFVDFEPFGGSMPEDWKEGKLGEICSPISDKVGERDDVKVLSPITTGKLVLSEEYFTKQVYSQSIAKYIVVPPMAFAYNPARVNIGSIGMNEFDFDGCVSPVYVVLECKDGYEYFFDLFRRTDTFKEEVRLRAIGGVRQTLNYKDFAMIETIIPAQKDIERFNDIYNSLLITIKANQRENTRLATLRDTLLPKLMKGEAIV